MQQMLQSPAREALSIKTLRIILVALVVGLVGLTIGAIVIRRFDPHIGNTLEVAILLMFVTGGLLVLGIAVALVIRSNATVKLAESRDEALALIRAERVPAKLSDALIAGAALVEGPGLLGGITYILGGPSYVLAAPILAAAVIAWMIPSRERLKESLR